MSINGVNNNPLLGNLGRTAGTAGTGAARPGQNGGVQPGQVGYGRPAVARPAAAPANAAALKPQQSLAAPSSSLPTDAPAGTDPALWSVLTTEERAFFAKAAASGPLTYGRVAAGMNNPLAQAAPAVRGGRLDVRA
jgi:hypothetical protein